MRQTLILGRGSLLLLLLLWGLGTPSTYAQQPAPAPLNPTAPAKPQPAPGRDISARPTEVPIDASIPDAPDVIKMVDVYSPKVRALDVGIGKLKGELRKGGTGAGSMGNFITDGMRAQANLKLGAPVHLALMNSGGMRRSNIAEGDLSARDIFELLPFENALVTLELNGEQVKRLLQMIVSTREAQSGARVVYKNTEQNRPELVSAKIRTATGDVDLDPAATYTVVTIDYLYKVGGDRYGVLREGKNVKELGITIRDAMINYVKSETAAGRDIKPNLDGRFAFDRAGSTSPEVPPQ